MLRSKKCEQRGVREILVRIEASTGTVSLDEGGISSCTVSDDGVGIYTLTFNSPFVRMPIVAGCAVHPSAAIVTPSAVSVSACTIKVYDAAGVLMDADVQVIISGFDVTDQN